MVFDWQVDQEEPPLPPPPPSLWWLRVVVGGVIVGLFVGGWVSGRNQIRRFDEWLGQQAQATLNQERQAFLAGDGDLFLLTQANDPAWLAGQLRPENQAIMANGPLVSRAEEHGGQLWANVTWTDEQGNWQRAAFFSRQNGQWVHGPAGADYWGTLFQMTTSWGQLRYHEVDQPFAALVADFVSQTIAHYPAGDSFTLTLSPHYGLTAAPNQIQMASPRLVALDEAGQPGLPFWQQLAQRLESHFSPAEITFAVPAGLIPSYEPLAANFMAANPSIRVNLVPLDPNWAMDPAGLFGNVDGAALRPSAELLAAGYLHDLTDLMTSDPTFDPNDFYQAIWQGGWWQGRLWLLPQAGVVQLIFYDRPVYEELSRPEPTLHWTWAAMKADLQALNGSLEWAFIDDSQDSLLAMAYSQEPPCLAADCPLSLAAVTASYEWYLEMLRPGQMPNLSQMSDEGRALFVLNQLSPRQTAMWVANPVDYELFLLRQPMGIVPFPTSAQLNGQRPLWVEGNVMSQATLRPEATWQWLKFLSYQTIARQLRHIPARPSVAAATHFWERLPRPLNETIGATFSLARPVSFEHQTLFSWEQLARVANGELTPSQAAQSPPRLSWFGR